MDTTHLLLPKVLKWAVDAAAAHVNLSRHRGKEVDPNVHAGIHWAFKVAFPRTDGVDYDLLIVAYSEAYNIAVKALDKATPVGQTSAPALGSTWVHVDKGWEVTVVDVVDGRVGYRFKDGSENHWRDVGDFIEWFRFKGAPTTGEK